MSLRILDLKNKCTGCGACASICPKSAIEMSYDDEGFYFPHLNDDLCVNCKACESVCHVLNLDSPLEPSRNYSAFILKSKDIDVVRKSSSGGAFTMLANSVLKEGGVVYGARYNYEKEVLEQCSTEHCSMDELRKSKYIESYTGTIFRDVRDNLLQGRMVLFCGTPCQIAGLTLFLERCKIPTDNLVRVRFVCHGVPSNQFFTEYKHYEENLHRAKMIYFDFRPKTRGWRSSDWLMRFSNGKIVGGPYYYYYYYYYFQYNYLLRHSCYQCEHLKHECVDFTIADFWGIKKYRPESKENEGLSLVLTHTTKAKECLFNIVDDCLIEELPLSAVDYIYNGAIQKQKLLSKRNSVMEQVKKKGYMTIANNTLHNKIVINKIHDYLGSFKRRFLGLCKK